MTNSIPGDQVPAWVPQDARDAAGAHPKPKTPTLKITESDPVLTTLYDDVQQHSLAWDYLVRDMDESKLYWLAGHLERPSDMADARWQKLNQNAWRAREAAKRRAEDRAVDRQEEFLANENRRDRNAAESLAGAMNSYQVDDRARDRAVAFTTATLARRSTVYASLIAAAAGLIGALGAVALSNNNEPVPTGVVSSTTTVIPTTTTTTTTGAASTSVANAGG